MAEETVQVGKYTLESLTTGMYSDPKIVYREYIQNSVDSLENAVSVGLIEPQSMRIDIIVNAEESYISIKDNGTGISAADAAKTLMNVGSSKKRNSNNRGFRGIGRLGGMSYPGTVYTWVHKVCDAAGLPHRTVHSLRHTNITMQIAAGVPLVTVAGRAGHARTSTTTDIYSHFLKSSDKTAADRLEKMFE